MVVHSYLDFRTSDSGNYLAVKNNDGALRTSMHIAVARMSLLVRTQLTSACKTEHILQL